jgi:serine protease
MGDWRKENECEDKPEVRNSSWHGQEMASIIAAPGNDGTGIAGIDWDAHILPVRVLGLCGGIDSDILDGMLWSAGLPVPGVPQNQNPARILNMSLGGENENGCHIWYQSAFKLIKLTGVVVVASAGNDNKEAAFHEPSNCIGAIAVGAVDHTGERATYSNWSTQGAVHISAPGGDGSRHGNKGRLVAASDKGNEEPTGEVVIIYTTGTSAAAAQVSGALSLAMRLDPQQHTDLLVSIMHETAQPFRTGSECERDYPKCGVGILDLELMIQGALVLKNYAVVRDFYHPELQHYFRSGNWDEVSIVLAGTYGEWDEFDDMFLAWRDNKVIGTHPVCRFYGTPGIGPNSHFYTVDNNECEFIKQNDPGWTYEGVAFYAKKAYSTGGCPRATSPVYRYYNQKAHLNDSNHRYTTHLDDRASMEAKGWVMEGTAMCVPEL